MSHLYKLYIKKIIKFTKHVSTLHHKLKQNRQLASYHNQHSETDTFHIFGPAAVALPLPVIIVILLFIYCDLLYLYAMGSLVGDDRAL